MSKYFVYKFTNSLDEIIYIGKAKSMSNRMHGHNHLPRECYDNISKIEYLEVNNPSEGSIYEIYYINKYSPKYNIVDNRGDDIGFELPEKEWKKWGGVVNYTAPKDKDKLSIRNIKSEKKLQMIRFCFDNMYLIENTVLVFNEIFKHRNVIKLFIEIENYPKNKEYQEINNKFKLKDNYLYRGNLKIDINDYCLVYLENYNTEGFCEKQRGVVFEFKYDLKITIDFNKDILYSILDILVKNGNKLNVFDKYPNYYIDRDSRASGGIDLFREDLEEAIEKKNKDYINKILEGSKYKHYSKNQPN